MKIPRQPLTYKLYDMSDEKLNSTVPETRIPFFPREKTTVRRSKNEVYPKGTDLSKPQFLGNSPLDKLFQSLERCLEGELDTITIDSLALKLLDLYDALMSSNQVRYEVIKILFHKLREISELSLETSKEDKYKNLISISLHDIKIFAKVVNLIIVLGIYPATLSLGIGIAIEKRRMGVQGKLNYKPKNIEPIKPSPSGSAGGPWEFHLGLLELVHQEFLAVFSIDSDVRSLLLKGTGYSDYLVITLALATVPEFDAEVRLRYTKALDEVTAIPSTYELYLNYSVLLSSHSPPYFRSVVLERLQRLPYAAIKGDGLLTLLEFIMGLRENVEISIEKMDQVADILLMKPKNVSIVDYFTSIGSQSYALLANINRPVITSAVTHFMQRLWLKNTRVMQDFFFQKIQFCFCPTEAKDSSTVLVSEASLNNCVNVLLSISRLGLSSEALYALVSPIWLDMWAYYVFLSLHDKPKGVFEDILVSVLEKLKVDCDKTFVFVSRIARNLVYEHEKGYKFRLGPNLLMEIAQDKDSLLKKESPEQKVLAFVSALKTNVNCLITLLKRLEFTVTQELFLSLIKSWADSQTTDSTKKDGNNFFLDNRLTSTDIGLNRLDSDNPFIKLLDLKILEKIASVFKDDLGKTPYDSLKLLHSILQLNWKDSAASVKAEEDTEADSDDEEDDNIEGAQGGLPEVVIELLSVILLQASPSHLDAKTTEVIQSIRSIIAKGNLAKSDELVSQMDFLLDGDATKDTKVDSQRQRLNRALAEIDDPLVPVKANGLFMLRELIEENAKVISIDFVVKTHIIQLSDLDPFVYLNAIKGLENLLVKNNAGVLKAILKAYTGSDLNFSKIDERLKLGEALLRYVQGQGSALTGSSAQLLAQSLLHVVRIPPDSEERIDDRLRMSAMSLLGMCFKTNVLGFVAEMADALDCALGILQLESDDSKSIMRRSALVLIHDMVEGTSMTEKVPFPRHYQRNVLLVVSAVQKNDPDILTREQAQSVLSYIQELVEIAIQDDN